MRAGARLGALLALLLLTLAIFSQAGPVNRSSRVLGAEPKSSEETPNEPAIETNLTNSELDVCRLGDAMFAVGESVPSGGLCERCICAEGPGVRCERIHCEMRSGCKALHRADHCCPLYQCECERNGKLYSNGEKLVDPENPCQVCYCRGGEIVCNQIACFSRDDCEPRYVPGRCCPEYNNCPPRDKDLENHIPKDVTAKPDFDVKLSTIIYADNAEDSRLTTESSNEHQDYQNDENSKGTNSYSKDVKSGKHGQSSNKIGKDESKSGPVIINLKENSKVDNIQNINIKEVIPINNEIKIKEILPIINSEGSRLATKSPTIPREATFTDESNSKQDTTSEPIKLSVKVTPEVKVNKEEGVQDSPVLKIGGQFFDPKQGDFIFENASGSTPSSVFTVVGAEDLQRGVEDQEDPFDSKNEIKPVEIEEQITTESPDENIPEINKSIVAIIESEENTSLKENDDEIFAVISEMYTSTIIPEIKIKPTEQADSNEDLNNNFIPYSKGLDPSLSTDSTYDQEESASSTEESHKVIEEKSTSEQPLDEELSMIPIEHLPEHNPEYPPIPEDISMTEDTLELGSSELEYSGANPIDSQENNEKIVLVKRPINPAAIHPKQKNSNIFKEITPEKILPDILQLVRANRTSESNNITTLVPEDWLKATERSDSKAIELNSPLLDLSSVIPDEILSAESDKDVDNDDSEGESEGEVEDGIIFVNNLTLNIRNNAPESNKPESTTDDAGGLTEPINLEAEFRSPGEPLLIPEWERNQTTENPQSTTTESSSTITNAADAEDKSTPLYVTPNIVEKTSTELDREAVEEDSVVNKEVKPEKISLETTENIQFDSINAQETTTELSEIQAGDVQDASTENFVRLSPTITEKSIEISTETITTDREVPTSSQSIIQTSTQFNLNKEAEYIQIGETDDSDAHTIKQKKTPSIITEVKKETSKESGKKGFNVLADLISLVGDVASMGNHDVEVSTVHNSIDTDIPAKPAHKEITKDYVPKLTKELTTVPNMQTKTVFSIDNERVELSEYSPADDKSEHESNTENENVELTTKKTYIDNDSDERNKWKSTDEIIKDIEIIPKVQNKISKGDPSREKIIENNNDIRLEDAEITDSEISSLPAIRNAHVKKDRVENDDVIIYTTVETTPSPPTPESIIKTTSDIKIITEPFKLIEDIVTAEPIIPVKEKNTTSHSPKQKSFENKEATTEGYSATSTVMKVASKNTSPRSEENIQSNEPDEIGRDKLKKRETNLQVSDVSGEKHESLFNILSNFFGKQYSH